MMTIRLVGPASWSGTLAAALAVVALVGCARAPVPSSRGPQALPERVVAATASSGLAVDLRQARCIVTTAERAAGPSAIGALERHPDLAGLRGRSGRAVARAYEWCLGAEFVDALGYEP